MEIKTQDTQLPVSPIYYATLECNTRGIVHQGGQWSGKTVNILAVLATRASREKNRVITITSESLPHLKRGALRDFETYISPYFKPFITNHNKTDNTFTFNTGSIIEFKTFENAQSASGAKRHYLYINEANSFNSLLFFQLNSRTDIQTIIDYNPAAQFWAHEQLIGTAGWTTFYSDHRHNPFLSDERHREIENIKDPELWRVYARGITGNVQGLIFPDWIKMTDAEFWSVVKETPFIVGCDFGYTNDPTAIVQVWRVAGNVYINELAYESGIPPKHINQIVRTAGVDGNIPMYCDHDPEMITQLQYHGLLAYPARKGAGSINAGIEKVKEFKVFYSESSINLDIEKRKYMWMTDPLTGKPTNKPIDQFNHSLDASRMAIYSHYAA